MGFQRRPISGTSLTYGAPNAAKFEGRRLDIERTKSMSISISTAFFPYEIDVDIDIDSALSIRNRCRYRYRQCSFHTNSISTVRWLLYQPRRLNKGHAACLSSCVKDGTSLHPVSNPSSGKHRQLFRPCQLSVVPTAWIADQMETGHHGNQSGKESH